MKKKLNQSAFNKQPKAVISINPSPKKGEEAVDLQTNGISFVVILDHLKALQQLLANKIIEDAKKHVGDSDEALEIYIQRQRQNPRLN